MLAEPENSRRTVTNRCWSWLKRQSCRTEHDRPSKRFYRNFIITILNASTILENLVVACMSFHASWGGLLYQTCLAHDLMYVFVSKNISKITYLKK